MKKRELLSKLSNILISTLELHEQVFGRNKTNAILEKCKGSEAYKEIFAELLEPSSLRE